eukprot:TRINITY_DN7938_c0_g1_i1.p1 TRINITY_DN7938_c0_g1~~TRINITY_DN7938_c0_g1_i1.p1  ORF type:complete len:749 (+),score=68.26 TRINITY_DN7938_c0_g1_i1:53-2299(+)
MPPRKSYSTKTVLLACVVAVAVYLIGVSHVQVSELQNKRPTPKHATPPKRDLAEEVQKDAVIEEKKPVSRNSQQPTPVPNTPTTDACKGVIINIMLEDIEENPTEDLTTLHRDVVTPVLYTCKQHGAGSSRQCGLLAPFNLQGYPVLGSLFQLGCEPSAAEVVKLSLSTLPFNFETRMKYAKAKPFSIANLTVPNTSPTSEGKRMLLLEPTQKAQAWIPHLRSNLSKFDWELDAISASTPLEQQLSQIASGNVVGVAGTHNHRLALGVYQTSYVKVVVSLCYRGMTYPERLHLEEFLSISNVQLIVYRSIEDSVQKSSVDNSMPTAPFKIARAEVPKIVSQLLLYQEMRSSTFTESPVIASLPRRVTEAYSGVRYASIPLVLEEPAQTVINVLAEKTKYDPSYFTFGPFAISEGKFILFGKQDEAASLQSRFFGKYVENDAHYYPVPFEVDGSFSPSKCTKFVTERVQVHYPWVRDNIYHSHNDNFWPIFSRILEQDSPNGEAILLLKTKRSNTPVTAYSEILSRLFRWSAWLDDLPRDEVICFKAGVWGRPKRLFSTSYQEMGFYGKQKVLMNWNRLVYRWFDISVRPWKQPSSPRDISLTWLDRKKPKRVLRNSDILTNHARSHKVTLSTCCDNLSFEEQVTLMSRTSILIGTHGAGLLHILFLQPGSVVFHLAPRRLNYHEQVVIERIAFAANISYLNSHLNTGPSEAATWNSDYFRVPPGDLKSIVNEAIIRYHLLHSTDDKSS